MTFAIVLLEQLEQNRSKKRKHSSGASTSSRLSSQKITSIIDRLKSQKITGIIDRLKTQQYRSSTRKNYYAIWKVFGKFLIRLDHKPKEWSDRLTLFVGYLVQKDYQSATVKSYISAIKAVLKEDGVKISEDQYTLSSLVRACKLKNDRVHSRMPIQSGMLAVLLRTLDEYYANLGQPFLGLFYRTIFFTMYFGLFRISEVMTGAHPVLTRDIHIGKNKDKLMFVLRSSKTHGRNTHPQIIKISAITLTKRRSERTLPCPFHLL